MRAWIYLAIAGALEIVWATFMKSTNGFTKPVPTAVTVAAMIASFYFLAKALQHIPVGTAYAVWTGIGAAGVAIIGMIFLGEERSAGRLIFLALIIVGVVGLKFTHQD